MTFERGDRHARVVIMVAAGRDFHNFNTVYRDDPASTVVAFTAAQIPDIAGRRYPARLAGARYPEGIPIVPESELPALIKAEKVDLVHLSYSDLSHEEVMHKASVVLAAGATFSLLGPKATMLPSPAPVIAVCAVRTGVGKSALARHIVAWLRDRGHRVVAMRHPMPYGDLEQQAVQRFATDGDLAAARVTVEEREEYEPYVAMGATVYAGVDYARILDAARREADVIVWDGGNNDFPFIRPDLHFTLLDAHRPSHELHYHPGEANFRMAGVLVISKVDSAPPENVEALLTTIHAVRPGVPVMLADLEVSCADHHLIEGQRVVLVEDGPTLTHGGMAVGAGTIAARRYGAAELVDARPYAVGSVAEIMQAFPHLQGEVPALGYGPQQLADLEETLRRVPADTVIDATPADLSRLLRLNKPIANVRYEFRPRGSKLETVLELFEMKELPGQGKPARAC
jgi:predicted GTPase